MSSDTQELPIDKEAAFKHLWATTFMWSLVLILYFGAGLLLFIWRYLNREKMRQWCYETSATMTKSELILKRRLFIKSTTYIPFRKICHITITQGPLLKKYGICNILVGSSIQAGGRVFNQVIPAIPEEKAEDVVALLCGRMEQNT